MTPEVNVSGKWVSLLGEPQTPGFACFHPGACPLQPFDCHPASTLSSDHNISQRRRLAPLGLQTHNPHGGDLRPCPRLSRVRGLTPGPAQGGRRALLD